MSNGRIDGDKPEWEEDGAVQYDATRRVARKRKEERMREEYVRLGGGLKGLRWIERGAERSEGSRAREAERKTDRQIDRERGRRGERGNTRERGRMVPTLTRSIGYVSVAHQLFGNEDELGEEGMAGRFGVVENDVGGRRHVAHTPSRRRLRLPGAYQPPSIISMQISIFYPVFPKFMQTSTTRYPFYRPVHRSHCHLSGSLTENYT